MPRRWDAQCTGDACMEGRLYMGPRPSLSAQEMHARGGGGLLCTSPPPPPHRHLHSSRRRSPPHPPPLPVSTSHPVQGRGGVHDLTMTRPACKSPCWGLVRCSPAPSPPQVHSKGPSHSFEPFSILSSRFPSPPNTSPRSPRPGPTTDQTATSAPAARPASPASPACSACSPSTPTSRSAPRPRLPRHE